METRTSKEWMELIPEKFKLQLLDPDGWDRNNFEYSFNEHKVTKQTFMDRLSLSTIQCTDILGLFTEW